MHSSDHKSCSNGIPSFESSRSTPHCLRTVVLRHTNATHHNNFTWKPQWRHINRGFPNNYCNNSQRRNLVGNDDDARRRTTTNDDARRRTTTHDDERRRTTTNDDERRRRTTTNDDDEVGIVNATTPLMAGQQLSRPLVPRVYIPHIPTDIVQYRH